MRLNITPTDIKQGKIVKPNWYVLEVRSNKDEQNKKGDAMNLVVELVGIDGDAKDVPFKVWFSEKAPGMIVPFLKALGFPVNEETGVEVDFTENQLQGKRIKAKIETGSYNNKPQNTIADWAPAA